MTASAIPPTRPVSPRTASALLMAVPMPLVLVAPDERIAAMNPRAKALFGTDGTGRHHATVLRQPALLEAVEAARRGGQSGTARYLDASEHRDVSYRVTVGPVAMGPEDATGLAADPVRTAPTASGGVFVLVSFEDITDVERAGQIRRDFVANVSHELKTPLTALLGFIETLRGPARDDAAARERFLTIMEREAERMNRLVADLLSLSRVESSERQRPTDRVRIDELVDSTVTALRPTADSHGVRLIFSGERGAGVTVHGDADQLQQVLTNLVENGIKYGASGGEVRVDVSTRARELAFRGPAVQIDVSDRGEGFDPIHIPRLTERFYRVDSHRSRNMGGTGLGLAIAKHIVNRHRGRFRIESAPGQGARFTVLLPATGVSGAPGDTSAGDPAFGPGGEGASAD